ncbi:MAG: hypothetical protein ACPGUD_03765 [Parashewanella sp.]
MLNRLNIAFMFSLFFGNAWADCSYIAINEVNLTSQEMVNEFIHTLPNDYEDCAFIEYKGAITVSGQDITDLSPLSRMESEDLTISDNPNLSSLSGLRYVGILGLLKVNNNPKLLDLTGLNNLTEIRPFSTFSSLVENNLEIIGNEALQSLNGLDALVKVHGHLVVQNNPHLTSIMGLVSLKRIGKMLIIRDNFQLINLKQLPNKLKLGEGFAVIDNQSLQTMDDVDFVADGSNIKVYIVGNLNLEKIDVLNSFFARVTTINISGNTMLTSLNGLQNMRPLFNGNDRKTHFFFDDQPALISCFQICPLWQYSIRNAPKQLSLPCWEQLRSCSS